MEQVPVVRLGETFTDNDSFFRLSSTCGINPLLQVLLLLKKCAPDMKIYWVEKRNFCSVKSGISAAASFLESWIMVKLFTLYRINKNISSLKFSTFNYQ